MFSRLSSLIQASEPSTLQGLGPSLGSQVSTPEASVLCKAQTLIQKPKGPPSPKLQTLHILGFTCSRKDLHLFGAPYDGFYIKFLNHVGLLGHR